MKYYGHSWGKTGMSILPQLCSYYFISYIESSTSQIVLTEQRFNSLTAK